MDTSKIKEISKGIAEIKNAGSTVWKGDPFSDLPGPKKLIGGNMEAGFFGECPASEFITGDELAKLIGLTTGTSQHSNEPWLKFAYMGKVEYIAKKPFRYNLSWDNINAANAVYGNRTVEINGHTYKVRLIKGKTEGKQNDQSFDKGQINHNSEWNKLLLPIHKNAPSNWKYPANVKSPTKNWGVGYFDDDLCTNSKDGSYSWCQERCIYMGSSGFRLYRGYDEISNSDSHRQGTARRDCGWRPVLEFVK